MQLLENKIIKLVEERGYLGTEYIPVIEQIIDYTQSYIARKYQSFREKYSLNIPKIITKKIDCVKDLTIEVFIQNTPNGRFQFGGGDNEIYLSNKINKNGKLEYGKIRIYAYSYNGKLYKHTMFNSLSHELNHLIEIYKRMSANDTSYTIFRLNKNAFDAINNKFSKNKKIDDYARMIIYRLMRKSELNAIINGVYGDLETINSIRSDFKEDIKETQAYHIYKHIKDNLYLIDRFGMFTWKAIMNSYNMISSDGAKQPVNVENFKTIFKNKTIQKLNDLIKGIGKIASFYYDRKEESNPNNNKSDLPKFMI